MPKRIAVTMNATINTCPGRGRSETSSSTGAGESSTAAHTFSQGGVPGRWMVRTERWGAPLWPELIGILGWQDIVLRPWTYIVLTALLLLVPLQKLPLGGTRARVAIVTGFAVLSYFVLVYLIFFITYTPVASPHVLGVQGRYFVIVLPMAAIFMASLINLELPRGVPALVAITGSMIAGVTSVDAVLKAHW